MPKICCSSIDSPDWLEYTSQPKGSGYVHVHRLQLSGNEGAVAGAVKLLSADEVARSARYYHQKDRNRFILSRAALRSLLSGYMNTPAGEIKFTTGDNKKPFVAGGGIHYNVSHAGDWVVVAISDQPVGVDVEFVDPGYNYHSVLDLCFSGDEIIHINSAANSLSTFYSLWTRKEALVKATAMGMDDNFKDVPSLDGDHAAKAAIIDSESDWNTVSLPLAERHIVSIAYSPSIRNVAYFEADDLLKNIVL